MAQSLEDVYCTVSFLRGVQARKLIRLTASHERFLPAWYVGQCERNDAMHT